MVSRIVIKFILLFFIYFCASAQKNEDVNFHLLFEDSGSFNADKIVDRENTIIFGITTEKKSIFPGKYLFVYDKNDIKTEIPREYIKDIIFSNANEIFWNLKHSEGKQKIILYSYDEETGCYQKYPVKIKFPPPPPDPGPVELRLKSTTGRLNP